MIYTAETRPETAKTKRLLKISEMKVLGDIARKKGDIDRRKH